MDAINLNANVSIKTLYADLSDEQIAKIEEMSTDGFTEDELQKLEDDGIDTSLIKNNAETKSVDKPSIEDKVKEILEKYPAAAGFPSFTKAIDDGLIKELGDLGYSKNEIVDIVNKAFPDTGIRNLEDGRYEVPNGHGDEATVYNRFIEELVKATSANSEELLAAQNELRNINVQITDNNRQLKALEYNITMLQDTIEQKIEDAIEKSEEIAQDQKDEAKSVVSRRLNEYTNSNGEMTYKEFQEKVGSDLGALSSGANSKLSGVVSQILSAQREMNVLSGYMTRMNDLISANASLTEQSKEVQNQIKELKNAASSCDGTDPDCKRCDPIGFTDTDGSRIDFFVDKDSDGNVTNENEFLGAENGFQEMIDADADGDGQVTAEELDAKNVKVVVTNTDGTQEIKNASEVLKEGDSIDLSSYQAENTELDNGNALLGTFSVNKDGQKLDTGYQTLDKLDWLDENYEFSDEINHTGRHVTIEDDVAEAIDYSDKFNLFTQKYAELEEKEIEAEEILGIEKHEVKDGITNSMTKEAQAKGSSISKAFEEAKLKQQEAEEAEAAELDAEAEAASNDAEVEDVDATNEDDKEKLLDEEEA